MDLIATFFPPSLLERYCRRLLFASFHARFLFPPFLCPRYIFLNGHLIGINLWIDSIPPFFPLFECENVQYRSNRFLLISIPFDLLSSIIIVLSDEGVGWSSSIRRWSHPRFFDPHSLPFQLAVSFEAFRSPKGCENRSPRSSNPQKTSERPLSQRRAVEFTPWNSFVRVAKRERESPVSSI